MIEYTTEGVVMISYKTLLSSPLSLTPTIEEAFGSNSNSLGIIVVRDLPEIYPAYRERLLKLSYRFGHLDEAVRESYSDPSSKYSFGWSHGKEIMNGKPDTLKGSFYANPILGGTVVQPEEKARFPEYYGKNIWPERDQKGFEGFEEAFTDLSSLIFQVGCELATACQPFVSSQLLDSTVNLAALIRDSNTTKGRLLHYFPPAPTSDVSVQNNTIDSWCGFHLDHSLLTGLCPGMFLGSSEQGGPALIKNPAPESGLHIQTRGGRLVKVAIPQDCLAFQTGEALEIATSGKLLATPHCVRVGSLSTADNISRESFALFMQPNTDQHLSPSMTFGEFSKKVFEEHYNTRAI